MEWEGKRGACEWREQWMQADIACEVLPEADGGLVEASEAASLSPLEVVGEGLRRALLDATLLRVGSLPCSAAPLTWSDNR